jgi:hypothetical protein
MEQMALTLVLIPSGGRHLEDDVDQRSSLGDLPMDTSSAAGNLAEVDNEVADRTEAGDPSERDVRKKGGRLTNCSG